MFFLLQFLQQMKPKNNQPYNVFSISELHRLLGLPKPQHPLISVINLKDVGYCIDENTRSIVYQFYSVCIKKDFKGKLKYGQNYYDFDEGVMTFFSPGQVISVEAADNIAVNGCWLVVHPDFIKSYPVYKTIKNYGFFSYAVNEALHLSEKEEAMIETLFANIEQEYNSAIDHFSQDVIVSHIELLLTYSNRFYNRQFITRKQANNSLLIKFEEVMNEFFTETNLVEKGLPTVENMAKQMNVSSHYLSDMLRSITGQSTQQHIHNKLIEKAKERLSTTSLSVSEIAYTLGFEHPQSFSKLFKNKTAISPLQFRHSFN